MTLRAMVIASAMLLCGMNEILTANLEWVNARRISANTPILTISEPKPRRMWQVASVDSARTEERDCYRVVLSDGSEFFVDGTTQWLCGEAVPARPLRWVTTRGLNSKGRPTRLARIVEPWRGPRSYEEGWLAGFFDGEGNVSQPAQTTGKRWSTHCALNVVAAQKPGPTLDRAVEYLELLGFRTATYHYDPGNRNIKSIHIRGDVSERLRFLGQVRPERLLRQLNLALLPSVKKYQHKPLHVLTVEKDRGEVTTLTTSGAYLLDGFAVRAG